MGNVLHLAKHSPEWTRMFKRYPIIRLELLPPSSSPSPPPFAMKASETLGGGMRDKWRPRENWTEMIASERAEENRKLRARALAGRNFAGNKVIASERLI